MDVYKQEELAQRQSELNERFSREDIEREDEDIRTVMATEAGRRLFSGIIARGYVYSTVFRTSGGDPTRLAYETGRREYAVDLYRKANAAAPEMVLKAIGERNNLCAARKRRFDDLLDEYGKGKETTR